MTDEKTDVILVSRRFFELLRDDRVREIEAIDEALASTTARTTDTDALRKDGPFHTVGQLRAMLDGLPADRFIACQVVGIEHGVWNMGGTFTAQVPNGTIACLTLSHPELPSLPRPDTLRARQEDA